MNRRASVSICIPTYNHARFIRAAVESALAQQWPGRVEVLVMDNASTDETHRVLAALPPEPRLRIVREAAHLPMTANWNRCVGQANGELVVLLSSDDLLLPGMIARAATMLERNPGLAFVHSAFEVIDDAGMRRGFQQTSTRDCKRPPQEALPSFLRRSPVGLASACFRRELWARVGGFDESYAICQDWHFWLKLVEHGGVGYVSEPGAAYRDHGSSEAAAVRLVEERLRLVETAFRGERVRAGVERGRVLQEIARSAVIGAAERSGSARSRLLGLALDADPRPGTRARVWIVRARLGGLLVRAARANTAARALAKRARWYLARSGGRAQAAAGEGTGEGA